MNNTKAAIVQDQARKFIAKLSTATLVEVFEKVDPKSCGKDYMEVTTVRGWIMDELEARNPVAFEAWLEDNGRNTQKHFAA